MAQRPNGSRTVSCGEPWGQSPRWRRSAGHSRGTGLVREQREGGQGGRVQPGRRAKSDHTRVGGQTTRVWGPWEDGWVLSHVRRGLLECWALSGGRETKEGAVPLLEREDLSTEVVGWGQGDQGGGGSSTAGERGPAHRGGGLGTNWGVFWRQYQRPDYESRGQEERKTGRKANCQVPGLVCWRHTCAIY